MRGLLTIIIASSIISSLAAVGCAASGGDEPLPPDAVLPQVEALSTYEASVGTLIEVYGTNFANPVDGQTQLVFRGNYDGDDGSSYPIDQAFDTRHADPGTLRWDTFGPFAIPFGPGNVTGTFHGQVHARHVAPDGMEFDSTHAMDVLFRVRPSLLVHEFQPLPANCGAPITRALAGTAYRLRVEAVGIAPESFTYTLTSPGIESVGPVTIRHPANGQFDTVGEHGDFQVPDVPDDILSYGAILTIQARDAEGRAVQSAFAVEVHRPLEFYYNGNVEVAEILPPVPVSACIPGGITGRDVTYDESTSETRARSYNMSWNDMWLNTHTVSEGSTETVGLDLRNGVGFATTDGEAFTWKVGGEVGGTIGLSKLVSLGVKGTFGTETQTSREVQNTQNREQGLNSSTTTTDTETISEANGGNRGESFAWEVSTTDTVGRNFQGLVLPDTFGVFYRQSTRLIRRGVLVAYNQCGAAEVVGDIDFVDWTWSPDLALGNSCPPFPQSNLPEAQCIVPPCQGE